MNKKKQKQNKTETKHTENPNVFHYVKVTTNRSLKLDKESGVTCTKETRYQTP